MNMSSWRSDPELQMFADQPQEPDPARLRFLRWLVEQGQLEHAAAGAPVGEYTVALLDERPAAA
jgi:hypothetical protein